VVTIIGFLDDLRQDWGSERFLALVMVLVTVRPVRPASRPCQLGGRLAAVVEDAVGCEGPVPEYPAQWAISGLCSQRRWWDGHDGDLGVGETVAADPAGEHVGQRSAAAGTDDQDVTRLVRDGGKDCAGLAALHDRLDGHVS
jgi:hypothetical protein